jgi:hypothetical protein
VSKRAFDRKLQALDELRFEALMVDLLPAFDRFFVDGARSDPQCLAKNALAHALKDLGHRGALASVECHLDDLEILTHLTYALADPEKTVSRASPRNRPSSPPQPSRHWPAAAFVPRCASTSRE